MSPTTPRACERNLCFCLATDHDLTSVKPDHRGCGRLPCSWSVRASERPPMTTETRLFVVPKSSRRSQPLKLPLEFLLGYLDFLACNSGPRRVEFKRLSNSRNQVSEMSPKRSRNFAAGFREIVNSCSSAAFAASVSDSISERASTMSRMRRSLSRRPSAQRTLRLQPERPLSRAGVLQLRTHGDPPSLSRSARAAPAVAPA